MADIQLQVQNIIKLADTANNQLANILLIVDKEKQREDVIQNKEVLLYKPYNISSLSSSRIIPPDIQMLHNKINNLEKALKTIQSSVKIIPFLSPMNYKTIQTNGEKKKTH